MAARRFSSFWNYFLATFIAVALTWGWYKYARLGEDTPISALNAGLAMATLFLLGGVLLLGPLTRLYSLFDRWLKYRRELGILAFITGAIHVYLVMFPLARRGPFGFYLSRPWSAFPGLAGLVIMFVLFIFSFDRIKKVIPPALWWKMQYWGVRMTFFVIAFHMIILKYTGWGEWFMTRGTASTPVPPAALLGAIFTVFVLTVRFGEMASPRLAKILTPVSFLVLSGLTAWLFL